MATPTNTTALPPAGGHTQALEKSSVTLPHEPSVRKPSLVGDTPGTKKPKREPKDETMLPEGALPVEPGDSTGTATLEDGDGDVDIPH